MDNKNVYVIHYAHKHGDDISVCRSRERAEEIANALISERADESWDQPHKDELSEAADFDARMALFDSVEMDCNNGETINIYERDLQ